MFEMKCTSLYDLKKTNKNLKKKCHRGSARKDKENERQLCWAHEVPNYMLLFFCFNKPFKYLSMNNFLLLTKECLITLNLGNP